MKTIDGPRRSMIFTDNNSRTKWSNVTNLSNILYKNILGRHTAESFPSEDESLTSLNWLTNINIPIVSNGNGEECLSLSPLSHLFNNPNQKSSVSSGISNPSPTSSNLLKYFPVKLQIALRNEGLFDPSVRHEYRTSWRNKPPFSYTTLICMAMLDLGKPKIALYEIYEWIRDNFLYYRRSDSSWQNSVRHNLSLKKCFEKVPRRKDERGKGGFWRINPNYTDNLGSNLIKYRRQFQIYSAATTVAPHNPSSTNSTSTNRSNIITGNQYSMINDDRFYGMGSGSPATTQVQSQATTATGVGAPGQGCASGGNWNSRMLTGSLSLSRTQACFETVPFKQTVSKLCYLTKRTGFSSEKSSIVKFLPPLSNQGSGHFLSKPIFKKPYALSSLNQYATIAENDHVISQICLNGDSAKPNSPTLYSLTDIDRFHEDPITSNNTSSNRDNISDDAFKSEMSPSPVRSSYSSVFGGFDDFNDSNTSSSFDTDFSCSSNFQTSSDDGFPLQLPLDLDDFLPPL